MSRPRFGRLIRENHVLVRRKLTRSVPTIDDLAINSEGASIGKSRLVQQGRESLGIESSNVWTV
jgi:hypothetical protein